MPRRGKISVLSPHNNRPTLSGKHNLQRLVRITKVTPIHRIFITVEHPRFPRHYNTIPLHPGIVLVTTVFPICERGVEAIGDARRSLPACCLTFQDIRGAATGTQLMCYERRSACTFYGAVRDIALCVDCFRGCGRGCARAGTSAGC